jgi:hypothetical protein
MVNDDDDAKPRAIQILRETVAAPNDPAYEVEQAAAAEDAKRLLAKYTR